VDPLLRAALVAVLPVTLAVVLPGRWIPRRRDRRLAIVLQGLGAVALLAGGGWSLWLLPGSLAADACVVFSAGLWLVSLFTVHLPCPEAGAMATALTLLQSGIAMVLYGSGRRLVLARRRPLEPP